jgi:hypothetical protein
MKQSSYLTRESHHHGSEPNMVSCISYLQLTLDSKPSESNRASCVKTFPITILGDQSGKQD